MSDFYGAAKKQLNKLHIINFLGNISIAGAVWVALLASRGFSMQEIMFAETVFHIVSLISEIPSGFFADVLGRKKSLIVSCLCSITSCLVMILVNYYGGVLLSVGISALSYNFASGTDAALAFDSLKEAGRTADYDHFSSLQSIVYRVSYGMASLSAGLALWMGYINAELLAIGLNLIQLGCMMTLRENVVVIRKKKSSLKERIRACYQESLGFLKENPKARRLIFRNALVGAVDVLLLFALQDKLQQAGASRVVLGPMLFAMYLGGVLGSMLAEKVKSVKLIRIFWGCLLMVLAGAACAFTGNPWFMTLGGCLSAFSDDLLQIRSDVALNNMIPESSRATLISVSSFCFSVVMIVLSPIAGLVF
ncbi:MAG: MFS transporter [Clostridiales bacterium]|nr:MFS transporter [Clostridiales bacterium]